MSKATNKFSPEFRARAVRMVLDHESKYTLRSLGFAEYARQIMVANSDLSDGEAESYHKSWHACLRGLHSQAASDNPAVG